MKERGEKKGGNYQETRYNNQTKLKFQSSKVKANDKKVKSDAPRNVYRGYGNYV
jgi:hypothetical protein